jgi:ubiquinone/menaquinone biosynthesis C-methylase UbiE
MAVSPVARFRAVAFLDELLSTPELLLEYAQTFDGREDAELVVHAPAFAGAEDVLERELQPIVSMLGLDRERSATVVVVTQPAGTEQLAAAAGAVYTRVPRNGPLARLPQVGSAAALLALTHDESDYERRVRSEHARYDDVEVVHDLPEIYHYWSNRYVLPKLSALGLTSIEEFFVDEIAAAAARNGGSADVISLGAGNCDLEIDLLARLDAKGCSDVRIHCLDLNSQMLERGRALAAERGLGGRLVPVVADLNRWRPQQPYDAVLAIHALHHFVELETIFAAMHEALAPRNGVVLVNDMIGRNGHQRWPEALAVVEQLWSELPERCKWNRQLRRHEPDFVNWNCAQDGFEGIRAQDILPLLLRTFHFETFLAFANVVDIFVDRSFGPNFDPESADDRAFIDRVAQLDEDLLGRGVVTPTHLVASLRVEPVAQPRVYRHWTPEFCLRDPEAAVHRAPSARTRVALTPQDRLLVKSWPEAARERRDRHALTPDGVELLSLHIPKTAGTAFLAAVTEIYGIENVAFDQGGLDPERIADERWPADCWPRVITGHFDLAKWSPLCPGARRVTWLRDPVARILSWFHYWKAAGPLGDPLQEAVRRGDVALEEFARMASTRDCMSVSLRGHRLEDLDFVGIQEHFAADLDDLSRLLGWPLLEVPVTNATESSEYARFQPTESLVREIRRLNPADEELYRTALELRAQRRGESAEAPPAAGWRGSQTLGGADPAKPERAYPGMQYADVMSEHAQRYGWAAGLVAGLDVLDLGCGTGYGSEMLTWTASRVRGFDLWQPLPGEKPAWPGGAELSFGHDLCRDDLPQADAAVLFEVVEHLDDAPAALRRAWEAAPLLVLSFPNPVYHGSHHNPHHVNDWTLVELEQELREAAGGPVDLEHLHQVHGLIRPGRDEAASYWLVVARRAAAPVPTVTIAPPAARDARAAIAAAASPEPGGNAMKRDWDKRAAENAMYFIASGKDDWNEQEFSESGRINVDQHVTPDLALICGGRDPKSMRALEIGCGIGRMTEHLAAIFGEVHGVDVSGEMIRRGTERLARLANVRLLETNGAELPFPDASVDFVFSFIVFQHVPSKEAVIGNLRDAHRVLTPGGVFKFQVQGSQNPHYVAAPKDTWHGVTFSEGEMEALAAEIGFEPMASDGSGTQYFWHWWRKRA